MKKVFTLTSDNGEKLIIRIGRNQDLSWRLDQIRPDWGSKPDNVYFTKDDRCPIHRTKLEYEKQDLFNAMAGNEGWIDEQYAPKAEKKGKK